MSTKTSICLPIFLILMNTVVSSTQSEALPTLTEERARARDFEILTADGIRLDARLYTARNDDVIIYCHRLLGGKEGGEIASLAETFADEYDLLVFDFRGHKSSFGVTTVGGDEILDLRAALSFAKKTGYRRVVVLGAGMGGTVGWRAAKIFGNIDALVVISPSGFSPEITPFIMGLASDKVLSTPMGRVPLRIVTKTRLGLTSSAGYPLDMAGLPERIPTLVIHSEKDRFVSIRRIRIMFEDFHASKTLTVVPGRNHAEDLINRNTLIRVRAFLDSVLVREDNDKLPQRDEEAALAELSFRFADTARVAILGDSPLPERVVQDELRERLSADLTSGDMAALSPNDVLRQLKDIYSIHGYARTSLSPVDSLPSLAVRVEAPVIHSVAITGNRWVKTGYIRRTLRLGRGHYNAYELDAAVRRLSTEPAIHSVTSRIDERDDGSLDILLSVTERKPYHFLLSTKFTDIDDFAGIGFTWNDVNPSGFRYEGRAMAGVSEHDFLTFHTVTRDVLQNTLRLSTALFDNIKSRDDLEYVFTRQEVHEIGGELMARYQISSNMSAALGAFGKKYESPEVSFHMPVKEGTAGGLHLKIDVAGALPLRRYPRFIWSHTFYIEKAGPFGIGDFSFDTYQFNVSGELKLGRHHKARTTLHGGWQSSGVPPQEQFSLGGMTTLPGYPDDSFVGNRVALASGALYLSAQSLVSETSVWSPVRLILSCHAGTVWNSGDRPDSDGLRMDAGFELDYMEILRAGCVWPVGNTREGPPRIYIGWGMHVY